MVDSDRLYQVTMSESYRKAIFNKRREMWKSHGGVLTLERRSFLV